MMVRKRTASTLREAMRAAKQEAIQDRARLIGAGIVFKKRRGKFNSVSTTYNGEKFQSLGEAEWASKLDLRKATGEIVDWWRPKPIVLVDAPTTRGRITIIPDFFVQMTKTYGRFYDYKGSKQTETPVFKLKVKLWDKIIKEELWVVYSTGEEKCVSHGKTT